MGNKADKPNSILNNEKINNIQSFIEGITVSSDRYQWKPEIIPINNTQEYEAVKSILMLPYEITSIEKVYNDWVYLRYTGQKAFLTLRDNKEPNELIVYHGSKRDPHEICKHEAGIDFRLDKKGNDNSWGNGIHFSDNPFYATANAFTQNGKHIIIIAKLLIGKWVIDEPKEKKDMLKLPPEIKEDNNEFINVTRYDLVTGIVNNNQRVFVYYENFNALPLYIVTIDTNKSISLHFPVIWGWIDEVDDNIMLPVETSDQIETLYRKGELKAKLSFKIRPQDKQRKFKVTLSINDTGEIENTDDKKLTKKIFRKVLYNKEKKDIDENYNENGHETIFSENTVARIRKNMHKTILEKRFYKSLNEDLNILSELLSSYKFNNQEIKDELLSTLNYVSSIKTIILNNGIIDLDERSREYNDVKTLFLESFGSNKVSILLIQKINNSFQKVKYLIQKLYVSLKSNCINEKKLFHGTRTNPPEAIYRDTVGFDIRYSNEGLWGKANYFAVKSSYSNKYAYPQIFEKDTFRFISNERKIFLVDVIIGNSKSMNTNKHIVEPPLNKEGERYDSVHGFTKGSDVYMIYENNRAYPEYLITYRVDN